MKVENKPSSLGIFLITAACFVIVIAGLKAATTIIVPFLLAIFVSVICAHPLIWLEQKGVPTILSMIIVVLAVLIIGGGLTYLLGSSINEFSKAVPSYQARLDVIKNELITWVNDFGFQFSLKDKKIVDSLAPVDIMQFVANLLSGVGALLSNSLLILLTVIFILLEATALPKKISQISIDPEQTMSRFQGFLTNIRNYLAIKTTISLITGLIISLWLYALGIDFPFLWGLLAFLLNFIPTIGSIIAAVPVILLGIIQYGPGSAVLVASGYIVVNLGLGSFIEPKFMGRGMGLSTLVVFVSLVFWGWVFGMVGMLLSVPLTMTLKIALESSEDTRWLAILLGANPAEAKK
ncbi:MAG: AI-2E family transporter [Calditrichaeota bacterium]|nr:AI-2E family transporter [Calditrichota bacterium]